MSENALSYLLNRAGYHNRHVPHGWRAAFSTIMDEQSKERERAGDRAVIDLMLARFPRTRSRVPTTERLSCRAVVSWRRSGQTCWSVTCGRRRSI
jgi:hypothetical protein